MGVLLVSGIKSQDFLGLQSSNYAGVVSVYSNPANIVDNRLRLDVALFGLHIDANNSFVGIKRSALSYTGSVRDAKNIKFEPSWTDNNPSSKTYFRNNMLTINNGKDKAAASSLRLTLPSFMWCIDKKNAIAFSWSIRNYINLDGLSQDLANLIYNDFNVNNLFDKRLTNKNLRIQQMAWAEYGLTYARVLKGDGEHFFKAGATPKLLQGFESIYMYMDNLDYLFSTKDTFSFFNSQAAYGHSDNIDEAVKAFDDPNDFTNINSYYKIKSSFGFGMDIGAVYEWRPKYQEFKYNMDGDTGMWRRDKNKYKLKASFSINDIGGIKYRKSPNSRDFNANVQGLGILVFKDVKSVDSLDKILNRKFKNTNSKSTYYMFLPTAINAQLDYNIWKPFYVNLSANIANIYGKSVNNVHDFTTISIAPRFDHKWFGVTLPLSYNTLSGRHNEFVQFGTMLRAGPLVIGTNNLLTYFTGDVYGANLYFLLKVPIPYGYKKDKDKDGISDKKDKCREVPGVLEFMGCPDKDGDHVQDKDDKCPDVAGLKELQGCPDKDADGITDAEDMCPDSAGTLEFKGCPDRDGDKIIDRQDDCPDAAGLAEFKGCPDKDLDGTPDKDDLCPDVYGTKDHKGCPDKDGDGIIDKDDLCPDLAGPIEYKGCPDKDGDKVLDKDDGCPEVAGPVENKGCPWPDTDKDGIVDREDSCVTVPGEARFKGCPPPMKAAERKIIEKAFASLEFATGKDIIKPKSLPSLNDLAALLLKHQEDWKLKLAGHTDNEGQAEANMTLSEKRSKAVKNYLMKKGVKDEQVTAEWFGQTQPIADNATKEGRQKNRRVEMTVIFK